MVQNLPSERKLPMGKVQKKTNNSAFSATHTYIKVTLVSFFSFLFRAPSPKAKLHLSKLFLAQGLPQKVSLANQIRRALHKNVPEGLLVDMNVEGIIDCNLFSSESCA